MCGVQIGLHSLLARPVLREQDPGSRSDEKTEKTIAVIVLEMRKSVLLVSVKLRIQNERDGHD